jgi:hypothetical protein
VNGEIASIGLRNRRRFWNMLQFGLLCSANFVGLTSRTLSGAAGRNVIGGNRRAAPASARSVGDVRFLCALGGNARMLSSS